MPKALKKLEIYQRKVEELSSRTANFIEKRILNELLLNDKKDFDSKMDPLFDILTNERKESYKRTEKKTEALRGYIELYQNHLQNKKLDQDLHAKELEYFHYAFADLKANEKYGKIIMGFLKDVQLLETRRYDSIKMALTEYMLKMIEIYGQDFCEPKEILKLLEGFNPIAENNNVFSINKIMEKEMLLHFGNKMKNINFNIFDLHQFLTHIKFEFLGDLPLVINYWRVELEKSDKKLEQPVTIAMTYDGNILALCDEGHLPFKLSQYQISFKNMMILNDTEGDNIFEFIEKKKNKLFFDQQTKYKFEFATPEEKNLFTELFYQYSQLQ